MSFLKRSVMLFSLIACMGCASLLTTTATSGTSFGMSKEAVLKVLERKGCEIISQDENVIVAKGMQEQLRQPAVKTFSFQDNRLISVTDKILDGRGSSYTFAN